MCIRGRRLSGIPGRGSSRLVEEGEDPSVQSLAHGLYVPAVASPAFTAAGLSRKSHVTWEKLDGTVLVIT